MYKKQLLWLCLSVVLLFAVSSCREKMLTVQEGTRVVCPDCGKVVGENVHSIMVPQSKANVHQIVVEKKRCPDCQTKFDKAEEQRKAKEEEREEANRLKDYLMVHYCFNQEGARDAEWIKCQRPFIHHFGQYHDPVNPYLMVEISIGNKSFEPISGLKMWVDLDSGLVPFYNPVRKETDEDSARVSTKGWSIPVILPGKQSTFEGWTNRYEKTFSFMLKKEAAVGSTQNITLSVGKSREAAVHYTPLKVFVDNTPLEVHTD